MLKTTSALLGLFSTMTFIIASCKKQEEPPRVYPAKKIVYRVLGTNMRLNFIDSVSGFQRNQVYADSFHYEFKRGPGAGIGISVYRNSATDTIYTWELLIDGKLYANALSEGGAYLNIPY